MNDEICKTCEDWVIGDYDNLSHCMAYDYHGYEWDGKSKRPEGNECKYYKKRSVE